LGIGPHSSFDFGFIFIFAACSELGKVLFLALSVCAFLFVYEVCLGTAERIHAKFTRKVCLFSRSDEFEGQGQRSKPPGTKKMTFSALSSACVLFVFGKNL